MFQRLFYSYASYVTLSEGQHFSSTEYWRKMLILKKSFKLNSWLYPFIRISSLFSTFLQNNFTQISINTSFPAKYYPLPILLDGFFTQCYGNHRLYHTFLTLIYVFNSFQVAQIEMGSLSSSTWCQGWDPDSSELLIFCNKGFGPWFLFWIRILNSSNQYLFYWVWS